MTDHICGAFDQLVRTGCCLCCTGPVFEVYQVRDAPGHPLDGHPRRVGPMLESGTQVEVLLNDGSYADLAFCRPCADEFRPETYRRAWLALVERGDVSLRLAGRSETARRAARAAMLSQWPVATLRRRRVGEEGIPVVDRRRA